MENTTGNPTRPPTFEEVVAKAAVAISEAQAAVTAILDAVASSPIADRIQGTVNGLATSAVNLLNDSAIQVQSMQTANDDAVAAAAAGENTNATGTNGDKVSV